MTNDQVTPCYFLAPDLEDLKSEIDRVREHIQETKLASQEGTEQSSESWHDNYIFEEAQRQLKMMLNHLGGLSKALERAVEVVPPENPESVEIGTTVTFFITDERRADTFSIGSYMVFDQLRDLDFISYETPIAMILSGAKVGDERTGIVGGKEKTLVVREIKSAAPLLPATVATPEHELEESVVLMNSGELVDAVANPPETASGTDDSRNGDDSAIELQ